MNEVAPGVFIGGWHDARDHAHEFDAVINCAIDAPCYGGAHHFPLVDGPGNARELMQSAIEQVITEMKAGRRILVHCVGGKSRSVVVTAMALSRVTGVSFSDAIDSIVEARGLAEPVGYKPHSALVELAS